MNISQDSDKKNINESYTSYFTDTPVPEKTVKYKHIRNYDDNQVWPLKNCPRCKCDLKSNEPVKIIFSAPSQFPRTGFQFIVITSLYLIYVLFYISVGQNEFGNGILYFNTILTFLAFVAIFIKSRSRYYICPECNAVLYHVARGNDSAEIFEAKYMDMFNED